eukprot:TRINITY_DN19955_c0_g1_i1.p1 TRINITY_DN19955_c0_g1~~TRINITY_DN19955_c0_g1_i1.p1  ORF type:complete len:531 (+),score=87.93 TRINITY_DN19955_c0_g1_i1:167-1759(+)
MEVDSSPTLYTEASDQQPSKFDRGGVTGDAPLLGDMGSHLPSGDIEPLHSPQEMRSITASFAGESAPKDQQLSDDGAIKTVIGACARRATSDTSGTEPAKLHANAKETAQASSSNRLSSLFSLRIPLLFLVLVAIGFISVIASTIYSPNESAELQREVLQLREQSAALEARAKLAETEQQDLARLVLDPNAKDRLSNMIARSEEYDEFVKSEGFRSSPESTKSVRACLGRWLKVLNITSALDVASRDGSWQYLIPGIQNTTYIGADISIQELEKAKQRPENIDAGFKYMLFDAVHFPLKRTFDLVLYRDVIEQQQIQDTLTAVLNFKSSGSKYIAITDWSDSRSASNAKGYALQKEWYMPNLLIPPFNFSKPLMVCKNEDIDVKRRGKSRLGIWKLEDLRVTPADIEAASKKQGKKKKDSAGLKKTGSNTMPDLRWGNNMQLNYLARAIGSAFDSASRNLPVAGRRNMTLPFNNLFDNFLESGGSVDPKSLKSRKPMLPSAFFRLPGFHPPGWPKNGRSGGVPNLPPWAW